jgi:hypothetical protein
MLKVSLPYTIFILFLLLSACSPQYQLVHDYSPPKQTKGMECVNKKCTKNRNSCQKRCNSNFQNCLITQKKAAHQSYTIQLDNYYHEMELYQSDLALYREKIDNYHLKKDIIKLKMEKALNHCNKKHNANKHKPNKHNPNKQCSKYHQYKKKLKKLYRPYHPHQPAKPSLAYTIREFQKHCSKKCQCDDLFNYCYIGCGGKIESRTICIKNCD